MVPRNCPGNLHSGLVMDISYQLAIKVGW